jgi:hypothetical protein
MRSLVFGIRARSVPFTGAARRRESGLRRAGALLLGLAISAVLLPPDPLLATVRLLLHAGPPPPGADLKCEDLPITNCRNAVTSAPLSTPERPGEWIYVLLARDAEDPPIGGVRFGINYQDDEAGGRLDGKGVDIWSWDHCGETTASLVPGRPWPDPGGALYLRWRQSTRCVRVAVGVVGYFYTSAYSNDTIKLRPYPSSPVHYPDEGNAPLHDCRRQNGYNFSPGTIGMFSFSEGGGTPGCNPCLEPCQTPAPPPPPPTPHPNGHPRLIVAVVPPPHAVLPCESSHNTPLSPCAEYKTSGVSGPGGVGQYLMVLASRNKADNIAGVQFGIDYEGGAVTSPDGLGLDILSWTNCAEQEFAMPGTVGAAWPSSGSATRLVWNRWLKCQTGEPTLVGYFYVAAHAPGTFQLIGHPLDRELALIADCVAAETTVPRQNLGSVVFSESGTVAGCNPCDVECLDETPLDPPILTPVTRTSWSRIKSLLPDGAGAKATSTEPPSAP